MNLIFRKKFLRTAQIVILCIIMAVMQTAASMVTSFASDSAQYIKVGLRYASGETEAVISSSQGLSLGTVSDGVYTETKSLKTETSVTLRLSSGKVSVIDGSGAEVATLSGSGSECIVSDTDRLSGKVTFGSKQYRGGIVPYINTSGQMNIINYISLDDYARGVVAAEIGASSGAEALKAQAIASKNFAVTTTKHRAQGFDVCTTTNCQVYSGVSGETDSINSAVDAIKGLLMYYKGSPITAYYFSNSGGHTENSEDVWTDSLGYLRGVDDPYSPDDSWTGTMTLSDLTSKFSSSRIGSVTNVEAVKVNDSGYVAQLKITGTAGTVTLEKDEIRIKIGSSILKSRNFTVAVSGSDSGTSESPEYYVYNGSSKISLPSSVSIASAGSVSSVSSEGLVISNGSSTVTVKAPTVQPTAGTVVFTGKGFGHGVGMSQKSAQVMAKQGMTYDQILKYFYTGIEIK